jgi:putative ABC transport system substrate-binding protein
MRRREFITLLGGAAAWPIAARAQQQGERMRRIGVLMYWTADDAEGQARLAAFTQALKQLGWSDPRIDTRWATADDIRRHAAELVALAPDVLVAATGTATVAALLQATRTVPIELRHLCGQFPHSRARAKSPSAIPDPGAAIRGNASFA